MPLRGILQRDAVAALPRRRRQAGVPPRVVGRVRLGQPAVRPSRPPTSRPRTPPSGSTTTNCTPGAADAPRPAARSPDRLLPPHSVPPGRAVPVLPLAAADPRGPARGRPDRLPAPPRPRPTSCAWCGSGSATRRTATWSTCPTVGGSGRPRSRSRSTPAASKGWPAHRRWWGICAKALREALGDPRRIFLGIDRLDYTKGIYARLRAYSEAASRTATSTSRTPSSSRSPCRPANRSSTTAASRRHRAAGRPDQRRPRPDGSSRDPLPPLVVSPRGDGRSLPGGGRHGGHAIPRTG